MNWWPGNQVFFDDLMASSPEHRQFELRNVTHWQDVPVDWAKQFHENTIFEGNTWTHATSKHYEIPFILVAAYIIMIPCLKAYIAKNGKWNVRTFAFYWNLGLSIFSWFGVLACVPVLVKALFNQGFYYTTCGHPFDFADGYAGLFLALFIYSKIPELVDTILLILANKPVIALQWWHHSTVLLYCWHSYAVQISSGAWFACMNYSVHSVMYLYFALMGTKYRKAVAPYAIYITLGQLLQMIVGIFVTVRAIQYQMEGKECNVNKANSILGLAMYASYFILFLKLFIENYFLKRRVASKGLVAEKTATGSEKTGTEQPSKKEN